MTTLSTCSPAASVTTRSTTTQFWNPLVFGMSMRPVRSTPSPSRCIAAPSRPEATWSETRYLPDRVTFTV